MEGYAKRNGKVFSYYDIKMFYDFYNRTSICSKIYKLDGEYYFLTDSGFKKVSNDDIAVFDKNKDDWSKDDSVVPKKKFDSEYAIVKNVPSIDGFLIELSSYMGLNSMVKVFKKMLEEINNEHSNENNNLKNQLQWIVDNQDVFLYMLS